MKTEPQALTAAELAEMLDGRLIGDGDVQLTGIAPLDEARGDQLSFAVDAKRAARLTSSSAGAVLVGQPVASAPMTQIHVADVSGAVTRYLQHLAGPADLPEPGIHPSAVVADDAEIGADVAIGPFVTIGKGVCVGDGTVLCAHVSLGAEVSVGRRCVLHEGAVVKAGCTMGDRVQIGPNCVIGYDGFGYRQVDGRHEKVPHVGIVAIEDDVEIGPCTCIDRAKFGRTTIGAGTKIDNLVQVAHNVRVGRGCLFAGQVGIAGSAHLGDYVALLGHAGVRDNTQVGDGVMASAFAAIATDVPAGEKVGGIPARPISEQKRVVLAQMKLPDLLKRVKALEAKVKTLESSEDHH